MNKLPRLIKRFLPIGLSLGLVMYTTAPSLAQTTGCFAIGEYLAAPIPLSNGQQTNVLTDSLGRTVTVFPSSQPESIEMVESPIDRSGTIGTGGVSQPLLPANPNRHGFWLQNNSSHVMCINEINDNPSCTTGDIYVQSGQTYQTPPNYAPKGATGIYDSTSGDAFSAREF